MRTDQETLQQMAVWLEDGRTHLPDHILDSVLEQLPSKPQRRPWWLARRTPFMNPIAKFAIAATAVVVVALVGYNLLGASNTSNVGNAPPSSAPSSSPAPLAPTSGAIEAGRYRWTSPGAEVSFAVLDGWSGDGLSGINRNEETGSASSLEHLLPGSGQEVTHVYADACHGEAGLERIGDTAADLVAALDTQKSTEAVIRDVTAGGVVGQRVEIRESPGVDRSTCRYANPDSPLQIWADPTETNFNSFPPGGYWGVVYVFDVDGERLAFRTMFGPEASNADVEAVDAIVESMEFSKP